VNGPTVRLSENPAAAVSAVRLPHWLVKAIFRHLILIGGDVLDATGGSVARALVAPHDKTGARLCRPEDVHVRAWDLRPNEGVDLRAEFGERARACDWLFEAETIRPRLLFLEPPWTLSLEYVRKAWDVQAPHGGMVVALLPLRALTEARWHEWLWHHPPAVYVVPEIREVACWQCPSVGWFVWTQSLLLHEARAPGRKGAARKARSRSEQRVSPRSGTLHVLYVDRGW